MSIKKTKWLVILIVVAMVLSLGATAGLAASVTPAYYSNWQSGNAGYECGQAESGANYAYKFDSPFTATNMSATHQGNTITITNNNSYTFDWTSQYPVVAVIVKAANQANVFRYPAGAYSDTGLYPPDNKQISHVTFCFNAPANTTITANVTATGVWTKEVTWDIEKSVTPNVWHLFKGDTGTSEYCCFSPNLTAYLSPPMAVEV